MCSKKMSIHFGSLYLNNIKPFQTGYCVGGESLTPGKSLFVFKSCEGEPEIRCGKEVVPPEDAKNASLQQELLVDEYQVQPDGISVKRVESNKPDTICFDKLWGRNTLLRPVRVEGAQLIVDKNDYIGKTQPEQTFNIIA